LKRTILLISLTLVLTIAGFSKFSLVVHGDYLFKDADFKEVYGNGGFFPSLELKVNFMGDLSVYGQVGYFAKEGSVADEEISLAAKISHIILTAGLNWGKQFGYFGVYFKGGVAIAKYKEEVSPVTVDKNALGFEVAMGISQTIFKNFLVVAEIGYLHIEATVEEYDAKPKIGGIKTGLGIGIQF